MFANQCQPYQSSSYGFQPYQQQYFQTENANFYSDYHYDAEACMPISSSKVIDFPKVTINTLYIPNISEYYSVSDIRNIFTKYAIAMVKDVDFVLKMNYDTFRVQRSAYIHIDYWFYSRVSANFIDRLQTLNEARLVVNDPEYWIILPSTSKKHTMNGRKLKIDLDSDSDLPPLVNIHVTDEFSAYEYEQSRLVCDYEIRNSADNNNIDSDIIDLEEPMSRYEYDVPFESDANSYMDTLDIGLRRDDEMFDMRSIQMYRKERMYNRIHNY